MAATFQAAIGTLSSQPNRCGFAPERRKLNRELRQLLFGRRPNVFRIVFMVEGQIVRILRIRRAARRALRSDEIEPQ